MVWPFGSSGSSKESSRDESTPKKPISWADSIGNPEEHLAAAKEWAPVVLFSLASLSALQLYANYLRRIPGAAFVRPSFFRNRSIFGKVTSVGDGDNFHLFHTPGGKAVGWGWLRKVPEKRKELKDRTVCEHETRGMRVRLTSLGYRSPSESLASMRPKAPTSADPPNPSPARLSSG